VFPVVAAVRMGGGDHGGVPVGLRGHAHEEEAPAIRGPVPVGGVLHQLSWLPAQHRHLVEVAPAALGAREEQGAAVRGEAGEVVGA